ncbi:NIPSNAP-domain-containing protein [Backusella circina FSU 941]|nr:NIPSNAP-domain-containing protein [Backusella circina FSU 941]
MLSQLNNRLRGQSTRVLFNRGLSTTRYVANPTPSLVRLDPETSAPKKSEEKQGRANEIIETVLYGSKKVKEEENQTHSKMLARGKYVHEIQTHRVKPEKVDEYIALTSKYLPKFANDPLNDVHLCGSWSVEIGEPDTFVHIWEYKGYPGHKQTTERLAQDPAYVKFMKELRPLLISRENGMMLEFSFWQTSPPKITNGIYELRKYSLLPGRLLEWEMHWRKGLECRRQFCEPVGAWFTQLGTLNTVYHMWQYPDLQTRKTTREDAWNTEGWAETVYKTVRLVTNMNSFILKPLPFSPLR